MSVRTVAMMPQLHLGSTSENQQGIRDTSGIGENDSARDDEKTAHPVDPGQRFTQEDRSEHHGDHHTQFVYGSHLRRLTKLQGAKVAKPRSAGCQTREREEYPSPGRERL